MTWNLRLQRAAERRGALVYARALYELLLEIGQAHDILDDVVVRTEKYAAADPDLIRALGGDRFPRHIREVA